MEIALADGNKEAARSWLNMWLEMEDDHPELLRWRLRLENPANLRPSLQKLIGRFGRQTGR